MKEPIEIQYPLAESYLLNNPRRTYLSQLPPYPLTNARYRKETGVWGMAGS